MIADADRAVALAGIMGGEETEIGEATTTVLLEAANFEPYGIFRTSERQHLRTEGSNRWEKGVDPYLAGPAADLATALLLELAGAQLDGRRATCSGELPERPVIRFRPERADALIGVETAPDRQYAILERLGFDRARRARSSLPTWRARDVTREVDVIEEVARFRLEDVPFTLPARREMHGLLTRDQQLRRRVEDALVGLGFAEIYTPSLRPDDETPWKLPEPISVELTALRTSAAAEPRRGGAPQPRRRRAAASRCSRSPASTCRAASSPTSASASPGSPRAASSTSRASSRRSTRR